MRPYYGGRRVFLVRGSQSPLRKVLLSPWRWWQCLVLDHAANLIGVRLSLFTRLKDFLDSGAVDQACDRESNLTRSTPAT
jgi:hypothetical protein